MYSIAHHLTVTAVVIAVDETLRVRFYRYHQPAGESRRSSSGSFTARAADARSGNSITVTPWSSSQAAPPPGWKRGGSRHAYTTRRKPLRSINSAHGAGRDTRRRHGSSEVYSVAPRRSAPDAAASASAASSAWSLGSDCREYRCAMIRPESATRIAPTQNAESVAGQRLDSSIAA